MKALEICLLSHFHKPFPCPEPNSWVIPTVYEKNIFISENQICLSESSPCIRGLFNAHDELPDERVGYLAQTLAAEYWLLKHAQDLDYVGVTGYRRYPYFRFDREMPAESYTASATKENIDALTGNHNIPLIKDILETYDVIIARKAFTGNNIETQFKASQRRDIWDLFIQAIAETAPEYKKYLKWFELESFCSYAGPMGLTPLVMFKEYSDIYIRIIENILQKVEQPFMVIDENARSRTDRWIGYLAERFYPFFLFVNHVNTYEVPTILLTDNNI
jgi:hypothetical protein